MAPQNPSAAGEATPLEVLVHRLPALPWQTQQHVLCKLLSTSSSVRAAVKRHCTGKLSLRFSTYSLERLKAFLPWLSQHGCLLAVLSLELNLSNSSWHDAESGIGAALQKAACCTATNGAAPWCSAPGLQLQSYRSHPAVAEAALGQLDSWYLTRLELGRHASYSCSFALEHLTRLSHLTLYEDSADVLLPSLCDLKSLTRVVLMDVATSTIPKLTALPPQLLELQLSLARLRKSEQLPPGLQLSHLTSLTKLTNGDGKPLLVQAGDTLPPTLQHLAVRDVLDVTPLTGLTHLSHISMSASTTPATQLQLMSSSSSSKAGQLLQSVCLCYNDMEAAAAAAAGWPLLPLRKLELRAAEGALPAATLDTLGRLHTLRRLEVFGGGCGGFSEAAVFETTQQQLARALAQMTGLEVLGLRGFGLLQSRSVSPLPSMSDEPSVCSDQTTHPDDALCAHTSSLSLSSSYESTGSTGSSSGSSGKPHSNSACGGSLQALLAAAAALPHLVCLTVSHVTCEGQLLCVDVAAAAALGAASKLTSLQLTDTGLTDAAVNMLVAGGLTQLQKLLVDNNSRVTADVLPDEVACQLTGLQELGVLRTGIRVSAAAFKARLLQQHPHLHIKSSAR